MLNTLVLDTSALLRSSTKRGAADSLPRLLDDDESQIDSHAGKKILCRQCHNVITSTAEIVAVNGSHEHTFANPEGILFQIGCFRPSPACGHIGEATEEWSWFKGFSWRVALCSGCLTHLGWLYVSLGGDRFHGLILDRLLFPTDD